MKARYQGSEYTIAIDDLESKTVGGLKKKVKEVVPNIESVPDDKLCIFHETKKVPNKESTALDDEQLNITDKSVIYIMTLPSGTTKSTTAADQKKPQPAAGQNQSQGGMPGNQGMPFGMPMGNGMPQGGSPMGNGMYPGMSPMMGNGMYPGMSPMMGNGMYPNYMGGGGMPNMMFDPAMADPKLFEQLFKDPDFVNKVCDMVSANASPGQRELFKSAIENLKNNPEALKQMMQNMRGMNMNPMMGGGMYPPPQMYGNPYMMSPNAQGGMQPDGACCHGYYPPVHEDGKMQPQKAEKVYSDKLVTLSEMGFTDKDENIRALIEARGDINGAIEILTRQRQ